MGDVEIGFGNRTVGIGAHDCNRRVYLSIAGFSNLLKNVVPRFILKKIDLTSKTSSFCLELRISSNCDFLLKGPSMAWLSIELSGTTLSKLSSSFIRTFLR